MQKLNLFSLEGKNIVITGGVGILGKTFCKSFLEQGANIAIVDQKQSEIDHFMTELKSSLNLGPGRVFGYECDITNENNVIQLVTNLEKDLKSIHVLHNNAAGKSSDLNKFFEPFEDFPYETWKEVMSVNVDGMFLMAKHIGSHMLKKGIPGSIIQTSSIYGVVAPDQRIYEGSFYFNRQINTPAVYSASKAAVIGLTNYLAAYWGKNGIRVNSITPGGMESGQNNTFVEKYSQRVPLNRMGKPEELVGALIYLASDSSSYVTGQNIIVDGGLTVW